jgi:hypothetical protein
MVRRAAKTVDEILSSLEPARKETTETIRSMIKSTIPDATEIVRHGRITYVKKGKDLFSIRPTQSHVDLLFVCGTTCGSRLLTGRGTKNEPRHVKIRNMSDIDESELIRLLKEAERVAQ